MDKTLEEKIYSAFEKSGQQLKTLLKIKYYWLHPIFLLKNQSDEGERTSDTEAGLGGLSGPGIFLVVRG